MEELIEAAVVSLGYEKIKEEQRDIIMEYINGKDVFGVLPTGFGKSLCFTCLPEVFHRLHWTECIILVVSPLIAIMDDLVSTYRRKGVMAACVHSKSDEHVKKDVEEGKYELVLLSPETLFTVKWRKIIQSDKWQKSCSICYR